MIRYDFVAFAQCVLLEEFMLKKNLNRCLNANLSKRLWKKRILALIWAIKCLYW